MLLAVRFVVFPHLADYRQDIAVLLSRALGQPVEIDAIRTGWDGWNPRVSVQGLRVLDGSARDAPPLMEVPAASGVVSWTSVLFADLRLRELTLERPRLAVQRDRAGRFHLAGFAVDPAAPAGNARYTDWLMRQPLVVVSDALVSWEDESRQVRRLVLEHVQVRLENRHSQHRFGLTGTPPPQIAAPIEVRGEFDTALLSGWRQGRGRLWLRLDYADIAAWREWLPVPMNLARGKGALRVWLEFGDGAIRDAVADVELADVEARLASDLPALDLAHLAGRLSWQQEGNRRTLSAQQLRLVAPGGASIGPANINLRYELDASGATASGQLAVSELDVAPLNALAAHLPLPEGLRRDLARHAPRGRLSAAEFAWQGPLRAPTTFSTRGSFAGLGVNALGAMPGLNGLSGAFEATQSGGSLDIRSRRLVVTLPKVFADPVALDSATGGVQWERRADEGINVRLDNIRFANAHAAGSTRGTWKSVAGGPGEIDLTARITRSDARELHRYMPLVVSQPTRDWVRDSIRSLRADDGRLALKGNLADFPFPDGRKGTFIATARVSDAVLDYANGWPVLSGAHADVRFEGNGLAITATRGNILGTTLGRTQATIADLSIDHPVLAITGEAQGATAEFLRFIDNSPVAGWIERFTDGASASGEGRLTLDLAMALGRHDEVARVKGSYRFTGNTLQLPGVPVLSKAQGTLTFTERTLEGRDLAFDVLGGAGHASLSSRNGTIDVKANGHAELGRVRTAFDLPHGERISGATDWQLDLSARRSSTRWTLQSTLRGVELDLPAPLAKQASDSVNFSIERRPPQQGTGADTLLVSFGDVGRAVAQYRPASAGAGVERALVLLGKAALGKDGVPPRSGVALRGDVAAVDVDAWLALLGSSGKSAPVRTTAALALDSVDIEAREFIAFGRRYDAMTLSVRPAGDNWRLRFASRQGEGTATWQPAGSTHANGRLSAQLARLDVTKVDAMRKPAEPSHAATTRRDSQANAWPEIDLVAERLVGRAGNLGRMELAARPEGTDWRITRLALANDAGRIDAQGSWRLLDRDQQTQLDVRMEVRDSGAWLQKMGLPDGVRGAPAKLEGKLAWAGSPADFEYAALSGDFGVDVGRGQFTKLDPGMGKLLGVLSLQALPRRITLDFRDVFSEGFAFDSMKGNVAIAQGVLRSSDLMLAGPAAKVHLSGEVDLERETQRLSVRVQPSLSSTVSAGAGAAAIVLLAANPLVGAAVGAGTLIAQKIMQDPIEHLFSYEYAVRGSWTEPLVERVANRGAQRAGQIPTGEAVR